MHDETSHQDTAPKAPYTRYCEAVERHRVARETWLKREAGGYEQMIAEAKIIGDLLTQYPDLAYE